MKGLISLVMIGWVFCVGFAYAKDSKGRQLQFVKESLLDAYRQNNARADICPASIGGVHGVVEWDGYGYLSDFQGSNHILYYSYNTPDTSLVDSTQEGCQQFSDVMNLNQTSFDRAFLSPGLQWANNNNCATVIGCGPLDDDGQVTADDRIVFAAFTVSNTVPYTTRMLVDTVRYDETYNRFAFDASIGDGQGGHGSRHELFTMQAPSIISANCDGTSCQVVLQIQETAYDSAGATGGLYGDDFMVASHLIAGYKVVAMESATDPENAVVNSTNWNLPISDLNRYIAAGALAGGSRTSEPIRLDVPSLANIYFAYVPIFNSDSFCAGTQCTIDELQALDNLGGYMNNSLAGRIASAAAGIPSIDESILESFDGLSDQRSVTLTWETSFEQNVQGFQISRSSKGKRWKRLNQSLIPAEGLNHGAQYSFKQNQKKQKSYIYKLDVVDANRTVLESLTTQVFPR